MPVNSNPESASNSKQDNHSKAQDLGSLEDLARQLAESCSLSQMSGFNPAIFEHLRTCEKFLRSSYQTFSVETEGERVPSVAGEWMLDNFYVVQQAFRQVQKHMPKGYYRRLPKLQSKPFQGFPRIYALALRVIEFSDARLDIPQLKQFIQAFQQTKPLTIGEIWAFPTMIQMVLLENLAQTISRITGLKLSRPDELIGMNHRPQISIDEDLVADTILSLRMLSTQDWKHFFENVSIVDEILRGDPAGVYLKMDFDTRDRYRKEIENLALASKSSEIDVAKVAIRLAQEEVERASTQPGNDHSLSHTPVPTGDRAPSLSLSAPNLAQTAVQRVIYDEHPGHQALGRATHVGFFLIDRGRKLLEARLGYKPGWRIRLGRYASGHPTLVYLGSILAATTAILLSLVLYGFGAGGSMAQLFGVGLLGLIPTTALSIACVNWLVTRLVPPRILPKMDFRKGIPADLPTVVAIPAILSDRKGCEALLHQLELHYLGNKDDQLSFVLLTDYADAPHQDMPGDQALLDYASEGIRALNRKYARRTKNRFSIFHRHRRWNPRENRWMGWERKRGKLVEFNQMLAGSQSTSYLLKKNEGKAFSKTKYVITLDEDTTLTPESAQRLVGTLAHPLNRAEFAPGTNKVIAGYSILQPRLEIAPESANASLFTRIYAGDTLVDLYTLSVSDIYQDYFAEGIYSGKGIYDVAAFKRSISGRIPENVLLSHDLFEGICGRVGLVTEVVLYENYPQHYLAYAKRLHRWIRGDWQLLPWLMPRVPSASGLKVHNDFSAVNRWKILDNLRRSLIQPSIFALLVAGWFWLPGAHLFWTLVALFAPTAPLLINIAIGFSQRSRGIPLSDTTRVEMEDAARWLLSLVFMAFETIITLDAIILTLGRLFITHKHFLRWTSAARIQQRIVKDQGHLHLWMRMGRAQILAAGIAIVIYLSKPEALAVASPFLISWLVSPQIAYWISRPAISRREQLSESHRRLLRRLARITWRYFESFVGPDDHWLPPDHFQEYPLGIIAHRTSPTNIGLFLVSTLAAFDLGYIGPMNLILRLRTTFESMMKLERYRGNFFNWYDTRSLLPLTPRYISTVDSGNLAACLITIKQGCLASPNEPLLRWEQWEALLDVLDILDQVISRIKSDAAGDVLQAIQTEIDHLRRQILEIRDHPEQWIRLWTVLHREGMEKLRQRLVLLIEAEGDKLGESVLDNLHFCSDQIRVHLSDMKRDLEMLAPWFHMMMQSPDLFSHASPGTPLSEAWMDLKAGLPIRLNLAQIPETYQRTRSRLDELSKQLKVEKAESSQIEGARQWCAQLTRELAAAEMSVQALLIGFKDLAKQAAAWVQEMDFRFLFNQQRRVFHIGYSVENGMLDPNHYDLLASEARITSFVAIAKGDVPQSHWLHLARPITVVNGARTLLSWNGSMFEYLMPCLLIPSYTDTLLDQSCRAVVGRQIAYGRSKDIPWGISEAAYYRFDANQNYQYQGFGVPGLGFKRGLSNDLVISPYASVLALNLRPSAVTQNLQELIKRQMLGPFGFYDALDYSTSRLPPGQKSAVVRSYYAHHQGMVFTALANYLDDEVLIRHFQRDSNVQSYELLVFERMPEQPPTEIPHPGDLRTMLPIKTRPSLGPWEPPLEAMAPCAHFLSNGRYGVLITSDGGGYSCCNKTDLTRWRSDSTLDDWGTWIYIKDLDSGHLWSAGFQPTAATPENKVVRFYANKIEFLRTDDDLSLHLEITVSPEDDVEIRHITLTNDSNRTRKLVISSYGEVVLAPQLEDERHPAFNKLFITSEFLDKFNALLFHRRQRSPEEKTVYFAHMLTVERGYAMKSAYETDREKFIGRLHTNRRPIFFDKEESSFTGSTGSTLDPIFALAQEIELKPRTKTRLAYVSLSANSRRGALSLLHKYQSYSRLDHVFALAEARHESELHQRGLTLSELQQMQQLLSQLLYPCSSLRAESKILQGNKKGQPDLWPYAISGDYPILLVKINDPGELNLVREVFRAHAYWRSQQLMMDLVILNMQDVSYAQELQEGLNRIVAQSESEPWLNRRGGIFLLRVSQLKEEDRILLETSARVVLDGAQGSLGRQLAKLRQRPTRLPRLIPTAPDKRDLEPTPPLARPEGLLFDNGLGGFGADGKEYLIYLKEGQRTPAPWVNVIANPHFGFLVSEAGSGFTWVENSSENRLTPWRNDPVIDPASEAVYLRDEETGRIWTPTFLPIQEGTPYLVRHGAGYSSFEHHSHGLIQHLCLFVIKDAPVKVIRLRLENTWSHTRRITATYYAEWVLGTFRDRMNPYVIPEFDSDSSALLARNPYNTEFKERVAFLAASKEIHGLTMDRTEFIGRNGTLQHPAALDRIGLAGAVQAGLDPCAALQVHLDIAPGETREVIFLLGQGENREDAVHLIRSFRQTSQIDAAWQELNESWDEVLGKIHVDTPDPAMNLMLNRWLLYQVLSCRLWGRTGLYQSSGAYGFRDQLQDVIALLHTQPELTREHILRSARHQFEEGDVLHWWHPPQGRGVRTRCSDDKVWLPYATLSYISTTGDEGILDEKQPFLKGAPLDPKEQEHYGKFESTSESFSVYEHCSRALERAIRLGPHGLPLIGSGDWNDGLNRVGILGEGESVWLGWFLVDGLNRFAPLCEQRGEHRRAAAFREQAQELIQALESNAWDGHWYRRAYFDDGEPLGSSKNDECQIASIAQSWAVLSGAGSQDHVDQAMRAVSERLLKPKDGLVLLFDPPFDKTSLDPGYINAYPPGIRENGGQYTHAATWVAWALAKMGQGDRAHRIFQMLNPISHSETLRDALRYRVEPYVVAADIYSASPHTGRGGWTWYTGSSGWMVRLGLEAILGIRREGRKLHFSPCIPKTWPGFSLLYRDGKTSYRIRVVNAASVCSGVRWVKLDGKILPAKEIHLLDDGREHDVIVDLG